MALLDTSRAILIWDFDDSPAELRALSRQGGDEDYLALLPPGMRAPPYWLESLLNCDHVQEARTSDGALVIIGAHS